MELLKQFISEYATTIIYTVITAIAGYIGIVLKNIYKKYCDNKTKKDVAKTVVGAVEQLYKDLHGQEKYDKAVEAMSEMLAEKDIAISELEIKMLIEAAVNEFNKAVKSNKGEEQTASISGAFTGESMFEGELIPDPALYGSDSGLAMDCTSEPTDATSGE